MGIYTKIGYINVCVFVFYSVDVLLKRFNNVSVFINNNKTLYSRIAYCVLPYTYMCVFLYITVS